MMMRQSDETRAWGWTAPLIVPVLAGAMVMGGCAFSATDDEAESAANLSEGVKSQDHSCTKADGSKISLSYYNSGRLTVGSSGTSATSGLSKKRCFHAFNKDLGQWQPFCGGKATAGKWSGAYRWITATPRRSGSWYVDETSPANKAEAWATALSSACTWGKLTDAECQCLKDQLL